jgi:hypothetical protein
MKGSEDVVGLDGHEWMGRILLEPLHLSLSVCLGLGITDGWVFRLHKYILGCDNLYSSSCSNHLRFASGVSSCLSLVVTRQAQEVLLAYEVLIYPPRARL